VESYRRIRNTLRFLLANTADFDCAKDAVAVDDMVELDRYAIAMMSQSDKTIRRHLSEFQFQSAMQIIQIVCSESLGRFYLDIIKDRLYTSKVDGLARRSAQTALHHILQSLTRLMSPILSFTAEEVWSTLYPEDATGIFASQFYNLPIVQDKIYGDNVLPTHFTSRWNLIEVYRDEINRRIEELRSAGKLGSSLQAEIHIRCRQIDADFFNHFGNELKFIFIVSRVTIVVEPSLQTMQILVTPSTHKKCERCWHYVEDIGSHAEHPTICGRCVTNLEGAGETRRYA
jgi:isoleucyl-tRNA synthetase